MAALDELLTQIQDETLRNRLSDEITRLRKTKKFGLVYEEHMPEATRLYGVPVRRGSSVVKRSDKDNAIMTVARIKGNNVDCVHKVNGKIIVETLVKEDLIVVAQLGEPIYPSLEPIDSIMNGDENSVWHTLIEADNYHALQLLEYLYPQRVDVIYIDPPYNTGAKDWKYNNDYVDGNDTYRHSKWLSMIEKRLKIAKRILNPRDSVLIVTIDEKEYHHLACLLEELFPNARIQMVTSIINPHGANRANMFARVEEYLFFVFIGESYISHTQNDMLHPIEEKQARWSGLMRQGASGKRKARPNQFYPIFFDYETGAFHSVGDSLPLDTAKEDVKVPENCFALFPINSNNEEAIWGLRQESFLKKKEKGFIKFGTYKKGTNYRSVSHLQDGLIESISKGEVETFGYDEEGTIITGVSKKTIRPLSVWNQPSHSASEFGSSLLNKVFVGSRFSFPKSLYAVLDTIRFVSAHKPNAIIVDFFAGSGTTAHAVNLLNAEDCGNRRCIMVTNNEISDDEAKTLTKNGLTPEDKEWQDLGIARYVNWERTKHSILGTDIYDQPLKGKYLGSNRSMSEGFKANAEFFKLGFLDKTMVDLGLNFKEILPVLWMKAGCIGKRPIVEGDIPDMMVCPNNKMAVLLNEDCYNKFKELVNQEENITTVFINTKSYDGYQEMVSGLLFAKETFQLYSNYIDNFRINSNR